jgi:fructose-bisphosphate aldolase class II
MNDKLAEMVPPGIRKMLGKDSGLLLLNSRDVFSALRDEQLIIMACNARIKHVIPGIMQAAEELDAVVAFELTRTEGGLDGGYTGQTPELFSQAIIDYGERLKFSKPFFIHGDHIKVKDASSGEMEEARKLIDAQIAAGFTSFTIDASFNSLKNNIAIVQSLAERISAEGYGLEAELRGVVSADNETPLTAVSEVEGFLEGLAKSGSTPLLLSIDNGSKSGNYLEGQKVHIDLERTREIFDRARGFGVAGLVQNGITGTPVQIVGKLADYGIRKGNIGTLWQNIAHAGLPFELMDTMRKWAKKNRSDIKFATKLFKNEIDSIPEEDARQIQAMAYREAKELLTAFRAKGSASRLASLLEGSG